MSRIKIVIHKGGKIEVEGFDFKGDACHKILEELCSKLGQVKDVKQKSEFYEGKVIIGEQEQVGS